VHRNVLDDSLMLQSVINKELADGMKRVMEDAILDGAVFFGVPTVTIADQGDLFTRNLVMLTVEATAIEGWRGPDVL
jgi:hypothetical protein